MSKTLKQTLHVGDCVLVNKDIYRLDESRTIKLYAAKGTSGIITELFSSGTSSWDFTLHAKVKTDDGSILTLRATSVDKLN
jgi:hypothetical protein